MSLAPVVKIPVDDSEFEKFAQAFDAYSAKLKDMPGEWVAVNARIAEFAQFQRAAGVSADKAWANATRAANDYQAATARAAKASEALGGGTHRAAAGMHRLATEAKAVTSNLFTAVRFATKLGGMFGLGAGLIGGGLTLGLDRLADSVLERQRTARGLGLTTGQYNSFMVNMKQYAGAGVLQGAANAQVDYSKWGYLAALGISGPQAQHETAATLAGQEIMAVHRAWKQNPTLQSAAAISAMNIGFSPQDIRTIGLSRGSSIEARIAAMKRDSSSLGFSAQVAREWSQFSIQMHKAGVLIETALIRTLTPLTPELTRLSREITTMIVGLEQSGTVKHWVEELAGGLKDVAKWLGSPAFKADIRTIVYDFRWMAAKLQWIVGKPPPTPKENNFLNAKTVSGAWAGYHSVGEATRAYVDRLTYGKPYQNKSLAGQIAVWNGHGANSAQYERRVSRWAGQMLGLKQPLPLNKAFGQYGPREEAAILSAMSREEGHPVPMSTLLPYVQKEWKADHPAAPPLPAGIVPVPPVTHPGQVFPGGSYVAPKPSDTAAVRRRYWQTHHGVKVKIQNSTAAMMHVSANAAAQ